MAASRCKLHGVNLDNAGGECLYCLKVDQADAYMARQGAKADRIDPASTLDSAIDIAEARLPHGMELIFERLAAFSGFRVTAQCPHCGKRDGIAELSDWFVEDC